MVIIVQKLSWQSDQRLCLSLWSQWLNHQRHVSCVGQTTMIMIKDYLMNEKGAFLFRWNDGSSGTIVTSVCKLLVDFIDWCERRSTHWRSEDEEGKEVESRSHRVLTRFVRNRRGDGRQ